MDYLLIFSVLVTVFSLALTLVGIPAQIIKNAREKRSGQPVLTILIALGFYASQIALFILTETYLPLIAFVIGFFMWAVTLAQWLMYRDNKNNG